MAAVRRALQNVILLLSTGTLVSGVPGNINSCNTTTHLATKYQDPLFIQRLTVEGSTTNTTRKHEIARTFLENCNAHIECTIPKMTDECVTGAYGYNPTLDFKVNEIVDVSTTVPPISVTVSIAFLCVGIALCLVAALTISWTCVKYRSLKKQNKMAAGQPLEAVCNQIPMADNGGYQVPVQTADAPETETYTQLSPEIGEYMNIS